MIRRTFWWEIGFLESLLFFHHFPSSSKKFSEFWQETFGKVVTTEFYMYIGTFWGILSSFQKIPDFFVVFGICAANVWTLREKFFATVVKIAFSIAKESFLMKKKFVQKIVTSTFLEFGKVFRFLATKLRQACQNFIVLVRRTFWGETTLMGKRPNFSSIPEFEQTVLRILTRIFGQGGHNRILRAQMKFFFYFLKERNEGKNTSVWKLRIAIIFRLWAKNIFSTFAGMVTAGLSKNRCTCSDEVFYKEIFWKAY